MPELPEVETTRRGLLPHAVGQRLITAVVRDGRLRWPVPADLAERVSDSSVIALERRAKYLLFRLAGDRGGQTLLVHLGMSGSLRLVDADAAADKHDHLDLVLGNGQAIRLRDPRRFGSVHLETGDAAGHFLLSKLGPEPLDPGFSDDHLFRLSRRRRVAVKDFIMNAHTVVGVGNIYANEALFRARIHPFRQAGRVSEARYLALTQAIRAVLAEAIEQGGTTLRDFVSGKGQPGYFAQKLAVYGRADQDCEGCGGPIRVQRRGQRASFFCPVCQR
ncbi:MAG: bifunctional DNA-formamidopyrimidine glycosylase/DNA-(apurinic or apyrimidinic site) lyase [Gammaproteobacteria bacterium]